MRVSLTARYVSRPTIDFTSPRPRGPRHRLGLRRGGTVFHRPRGARATIATVAALRAPTSGFSFPTVGRTGRVRSRRAVPSLGSPRVRRA